MNSQEGLEFIRDYFGALFGQRNVDALDQYLDKAYFDDDIGDPSVDHIQNSKDFLNELFVREPTVGVNVVDAICLDDVITAYLEWYRLGAGNRQVIRRGVAVFVLNGRRIIKRHTFIYASNE